MEPVSFGNCFGWLHPGRAARGVVLMNPFGYEELCARKTFVSLAQALSARGVPVLRFDWSGTGDSLGGPADPRQFERWRGDAQMAIATFKSLTGVKEIVLVGLRLGAMLAAEAACARDDISRLALLAPPASGRAWLREATTFARTMTATGAASVTPEGLEIVGFRLASDSVAAIRAQEWSALPTCPAPQIDIYAPEAGNGERIAQYMNALGAQTQRHAFDGYERMMCDPTESEAPPALIEHLADTIAARAPILEPALAQAIARPAFAPLAGHGFVESPARIGVDAMMSGIFCQPVERSARNEAAIFLAAGAIHHAGWARSHVDLSRRLARQGVASLRLDLPSVGDSARYGAPQPLPPYAQRRNDEISAAIGWLKARGYRRITLMGTCSGAYHAFHAALADERVDGLALLNPLCFMWDASHALRFKAWKAVVSHTTHTPLLAAASASEEALDAVRTLARLMPVAKKMADTGLSALMSMQAYASQLLAPEHSVEAAFIKLSLRGVRILLAYSAGDSALDELERHLGAGGAKAAALPGVSTCRIEDADHMLTPQKARNAFAESFVAFLGESAKAQPLPQATPHIAGHLRPAVA